MGTFNCVKPIISDTFKNQLTTGILSSPILYVHHTHVRLVDDALKEILSRNTLGLTDDCILQFSDRSIMDFHTKHSYSLLKSTRVVEKDTTGRNESSFSKSKDSISEIADRFKEYGSANSVLDAIISLDEHVKSTHSKIIGNKRIFLFNDINNFLSNENILSKLLAYSTRYEQGCYPRETTLIIVSPQPLDSLPIEFQNLVKLIEIPAPSESEILKMTENLPISKHYENQEEDLRNDLCRTLLGLQIYEILDIMRSCVVRTGYTLTEQTIHLALEEKKNIVKKSGIIEVVDSDIDFSQIGGLENLQDDLKKKATLYKNLKVLQDIRFPYPKGVLVLGMPGCGKSMIAKSIANEFGVSLLRLDVNRLMGQYVGQSEANLRKALATAEAAHPCVLWIDEIEKAFAGSNGQNNDMLVMRLMGAFLTWMQERKTAVYIVATANDVMRPEFMRKGRFDEVYYVDFPNAKEREEILRKKIEHFQGAKNSQKYFDFSKMTQTNLNSIAKDMEGTYGGFSGAEIECVVNNVIENALVRHLESKEKKPVTIELSDFSKIVTELKPSVMSNQKGKEENGIKQKTSIERIRDLQEIYKFRKASK